MVIFTEKGTERPKIHTAVKRRDRPSKSLPREAVARFPTEPDGDRAPALSMPGVGTSRTAEQAADAEGKVITG